MNALAPPILSKRARQAELPPLSLVEGIDLAPGRAHELCGPSRRMLALLAAASVEGPVIWIAPAWRLVRPNPAGIRDWLNPGRITYITPERIDDLLWCMEEAMRSGVAPLVVADLSDPPGLTPVRRLHFAAKTGTATGGSAPTGLVLTPDGAAPGVESRWSVAPAGGPGRFGWRIERRHARTAPPKAWEIDLHGRKRAPSSSKEDGRSL